MVPVPNEEIAMSALIYVIHLLFTLYSLAIIGRVFLEMVVGPRGSVIVFLRAITEPLLAPIRRHLPVVRSGGVAWDLSPVVALLLLWVAERILIRLLVGAF